MGVELLNVEKERGASFYPDLQACLQTHGGWIELKKIEIEKEIEEST